MDQALNSFTGGTVLLSAQWATDALNWTSGALVVAFLVAYLVVLGLVCIYGTHRYYLVHLYYKHRRNIPRLGGCFRERPRVTIQLPMYNERAVARRIIDATCRIAYPRDRLQIQVLDDSTDETVEIARRAVDYWRGQGFDIEHIHRENRQGYKAGALSNGLKTASGEFVLIFDADFVPPAEILAKTIDYFTDPAVGMVQARWEHINRDQSLLTKTQAILLDGHFVIEHAARNRSGRFMSFNGTAGMWRKSCIEDAGGWQHDTLTEDSDLSYRAQLKGWKFMYLPWVECPSELPTDTYGFQVQQQRWAKGLTQVSMKLWGTIWRSDAGWREKAEAWFHLTPNISYPMMVIVSALMLPVMMVRFYIGWQQLVFVDLPLIICSFWSIVAFYLLAEKELYPDNWKRAIFILPFLMAMGVALTISNTKAVLEALMKKQSSFVRTPKYAPKAGGAALSVGYRRKSGWLPFAEIAMGIIFLFIVAYCIDVMNLFALPFLCIFVCGYLWAGCSTLWQEFQAKRRFERAARKVELEAVS